MSKLFDRLRNQCESADSDTEKSRGMQHIMLHINAKLLLSATESIYVDCVISAQGAFSLLKNYVNYVNGACYEGQEMGS